MSTTAPELMVARAETMTSISRLTKYQQLFPSLCATLPGGKYVALEKLIANSLNYEKWMLRMETACTCATVGMLFSALVFLALGVRMVIAQRSEPLNICIVISTSIALGSALWFIHSREIPRFKMLTYTTFTASIADKLAGVETVVPGLFPPHVELLLNKKIIQHTSEPPIQPMTTDLDLV